MLYLYALINVVHLHIPANIVVVMALHRAEWNDVASGDDKLGTWKWKKNYKEDTWFFDFLYGPSCDPSDRKEMLIYSCTRYIRTRRNIVSLYPSLNLMNIVIRSENRLLHFRHTRLGIIGLRSIQHSCDVHSSR